MTPDMAAQKWQSVLKKQDQQRQQIEGMLTIEFDQKVFRADTVKPKPRACVASVHVQTIFNLWSSASQDNLIMTIDEILEVVSNHYQSLGWLTEVSEERVRILYPEQ